MIRRRLTGLLATCAIAAILVGLPAVLLAVGYGTLPRISSWTDLVEVAMRRDDGTLALLVLKTVGWIAWAILADSDPHRKSSPWCPASGLELPGLHLPQTSSPCARRRRSRPVRPPPHLGHTRPRGADPPPGRHRSPNGRRHHHPPRPRPRRRSADATRLTPAPR